MVSAGKTGRIVTRPRAIRLMNQTGVSCGLRRSSSRELRPGKRITQVRMDYLSGASRRAGAGGTMAGGGGGKFGAGAIEGGESGGLGDGAGGGAIGSGGGVVAGAA